MSQLPLLSPTAGARALVALACLAVAGSPAATNRPAVVADPTALYTGGDEVMERELWLLLEKAGREGVVLEEVVDRIVRKGPRVVPVLFAILSGELTAPDRELRWDRSAGPHDASTRDSAILVALSQMPTEDVFEHLHAVAASDPTTDMRLTAALVLAESPDGRALDVMVEVLAGMDPTHLAATYVAERTEQALRRLLERHPHQMRELDSERYPLPARLIPIVIQAVPSECAVESARLLLRFFGRADELDVLLMRRLSELADSPFGAGDVFTREETLARVRAHLRHPDWRMRREAVVATGYLHDLDSWSDLTRLLDDPERAVQRASQWSLERISGRKSEGAAAWISLFEAEDRWLHDHLPEIEERLRSGSEAAVVDAVRALTRRPLFRHRSTEVLAPLVGRSVPVLVEVACSALVQLDSPCAVPVLVRALDHTDSRSRKAVWKALKSISGRNLPPERQTWENELGLQ